MSEVDEMVLTYAAKRASRALLTTPGRLDPYPHYAVLRDHEPALDTDTGWVMVSRYADCDRVVRDADFRVGDREWYAATFGDEALRDSSRLTQDSMLFTNPPRHERMRKLVSWAFTPRRVAAMHASVQARVTQLLDELADAGADGSTVDFNTAFAYRLPMSVIGDMFGVPEQDRAQFGPWAFDLDATLELTQTRQDLDRADTAAAAMMDYFTELIAHRRRAPADDLISGLIEVSNADTGDDRLSPEELLSNIALVLVNGFATTNDLASNGLALLLEQPQLLDRLRADPGLSPAYVEEVLRFESPVQLVMRVVGAPTELGGVSLAPGHLVVALLGAANRDERRFDRPEVFDPARANNQPLSFGAGPHFCFGAALARLEARIAFADLARRFPRIAQAGPAVRRDRLTLRGLSELPITIA
ncbi:cytochrome P450 [Krasilnikovia sp. M28-CT-15]|uniref:cytochrome P450 n=1 Tax=Krasilnikovia sp. M28-CT-15 TaxID=3373540 RepID=UPI00387776AF